MQRPQDGQPGLRSLDTADPHHQRAPSLGDIHQQLESEQEAQVNRLLHMIQVQQDQLAEYQGQDESPNAASVIVDSASGSTRPGGDATSQQTSATSPVMSHNAVASHASQSPLRRPASISRHSSRSVVGLHSNASSPLMRPMSSSRPSQDEWSLGGTRDETAFYQTEAQNLQRENQMLKQRIRELEHQVQQLNTSAPSGT